MLFEKEKVISWIDDQVDNYYKVSDAIWRYAELGCEEHKSAKLIQNLLENRKFEVKADVAGLPTASVANTMPCPGFPSIRRRINTRWLPEPPGMAADTICSVWGP